MSSVKKLYGLPIINPLNLRSMIKMRKIGGFRKLGNPEPIREYLQRKLTKAERGELKFVPKVEAVKLKDPRGDKFTGFRAVLKNGVAVFTLLPGNFLPICAEFRHGCGRVILSLPAGLIEPDDKNPEVAAKREFGEEIGVKLKKLIPLNSRGIPIDARVLTRENFFFLGIPIEPIKVKKRKMQKAEFIAKFLVSLDDWLTFMELGAVDDFSIAATLLALKKINKL